MARKNGESKRDISNSAGLIIYVVLVTLFSVLMLYGFRGLENPENLTKFIFYAVVLIILTLYVILDKFLFKTFDLTYIHEPEKGFFNQIDIIKNPLKLGLLSLVLFMPIFIFNIITTQKSFVGFTQFQIAPVAEVWTAVEPAVITETLILVVLVGLGYYLAKKYSKNNPSLFWIINGITLFMATYFMKLIHDFRYGAQDFSIYSVFIFFFISILILQVTGSIIPVWVIHALNNGFGSAMTVFSSDLLIVATIFVYVLILVGFIYLVSKGTKSTKKLGAFGI